MINRTYLCIGGPLDGQRYACEAPYFRAPVYDKPVMFDPRAKVIGSIKTVEYQEDGVWLHKEGAMLFWRPANQTLFESMAMLFDKYGV